MIYARFKTYADDYRPVNWPIKHPYWCTGHGGADLLSDTGDDEYSILVAYADDLEELLENWPEAIDIDAEIVDSYVFTDRLQCPDWFETKTPKPPKMTIDEAKQEKQRLSEGLYELIADFEADTGLEVAEIDLQRARRMTGGAELLDVRVEAIMPK